jgi:hypothetical protein
VLKGDAAGMAGKGSGKVLNSTAEDNVFINFSDHGAPLACTSHVLCLGFSLNSCSLGHAGGPGIIAFPSTTLSAKDLNEVLR